MQSINQKINKKQQMYMASKATINLESGGNQSYSKDESSIVH